MEIRQRRSRALPMLQAELAFVQRRVVSWGGLPVARASLDKLAWHAGQFLAIPL